MNVPAPLALGLDFGGTKLAAGLVETQGGALVAELRRPTEVDLGAARCLELMLEMARELLARAPGPVEGVGINFGGPVDAAAGVVLRSHHVLGWEGVHLAAHVAAALGLPAVLDNDANGQALAEWCFGAGRESRAMAYLNVGTGIGGGIVLDGRLWRGAHGLAGEFGHLVIWPDGPACTCGRRGCLEALCAGPAMGRRAREALAALPPGDPRASVLVQTAGRAEAVSGRELTAAAAAGDALALEVLDGVLADLALGIVAVMNSIDPDLIVLGGGAADLAPQAFQRLEEHVYARCLPGSEAYVRLKPAALGADAGIFGGAALFLQR